jgi:hypothetical protein
MSTRNISKTVTNGEETITKNYLLEFNNGTLTVSLVTDEATVPVLVQPWKCNPDGTREDFVDADDAFDWLESLKDSII